MADTLVTNVNGIQVGADGKLQHFRALMIGDDGKVRAVRHREPMRRESHEQRSMAQGGRCCPG